MKGVLSFLLSSALLSSAAAGTMETRFTTVVLEDVPVGAPVAVCLADGAYYGVRNASDRPLPVRFSAVAPGYCEPTPGGVRYEPIPSLDWIGIEPASVTVPPGGEAEALVTVTVSNAVEHVGRRYEFWLRAQTDQGQAGVALVSRVRFNTVSADRRPPPPEKPPRRPNERPRKPFWKRLW